MTLTVGKSLLRPDVHTEWSPKTGVPLTQMDPRDMRGSDAPPPRFSTPPFAHGRDSTEEVLRLQTCGRPKFSPTVPTEVVSEGVHVGVSLPERAGPRLSGPSGDFNGFASTKTSDGLVRTFTGRCLSGLPHTSTERHPPPAPISPAVQAPSGGHARDASPPEHHRLATVSKLRRGQPGSWIVSGTGGIGRWARFGRPPDTTGPSDYFLAIPHE